ncbi:unnamed protein product [Staurois parvus]|uniref:Homing endonuclease LAGLIDADG domain-containing protein n=1 Tax=Staurois parvus TaxID=386267 RepID=A0ABN9BPQ2_9NEOB|nr:unnamed protein product [Staurois parvus]
MYCYRGFFFLGRVHVISTGPISTAERNLLLHVLANAGLDTDRSHKPALISDNKMYLAVYIY